MTAWKGSAIIPDEILSGACPPDGFFHKVPQQSRSRVSKKQKERRQKTAAKR
ncbi:hypothetical protein [Bacillus songklensis]|uniref:hypothetical protein n=1 Tax=Bacillus songklensis TaxID=1069116 RepID=UPI00366CEF1D